MTDPVLVTVAHGTRRQGGNETARRITERAAARLGVPAVAAYVELSEPLLSDVIGRVSRPAVVVPLLLSTGYHVRQDVPAACRGTVAAVGGSLGPDPRLARAQVARLREAGAPDGAPVVMVAAGTRDPAGLRDLERARDLLSDAWRAPARLATLDGHGDRPADVLRPGDAVSPYLLSPGVFSRRVADLALRAGALTCADVLGAHHEVVDLVAARATDLLSGTSRSAAGRAQGRVSPGMLGRLALLERVTP